MFSLFLYMNFYLMFFVLFFNITSFLNLLMLLELMMLMILMVMYTGFFLSGVSFYFLIYFLVFVVCEAVLGLTLLVYCLRLGGSDYILISNLKW